jgi:hypothetical protein
MMHVFFHIPKLKINNENFLDRSMAQKYPLGSLGSGFNRRKVHMDPKIKIGCGRTQ